MQRPIKPSWGCSMLSLITRGSLNPFNLCFTYSLPIFPPFPISPSSQSRFKPHMDGYLVTYTKNPNPLVGKPSLSNPAFLLTPFPMTHLPFGPLWPIALLCSPDCLLRLAQALAADIEALPAAHLHPLQPHSTSVETERLRHEITEVDIPKHK